MKIPVLVKNETWKEHMEKLNEEVKELHFEIALLCHETEKEDYKKIAGEAFDVIQVCIGILDKVEQDHPGMVNQISKEHLIKLMQRNWLIKNILEVRVD